MFTKAHFAFSLLHLQRRDEAVQRGGKEKGRIKTISITCTGWLDVKLKKKRCSLQKVQYWFPQPGCKKGLRWFDCDDVRQPGAPPPKLARLKEGTEKLYEKTDKALPWLLEQGSVREVLTRLIHLRFFIQDSPRRLWFCWRFVYVKCESFLSTVTSVLLAMKEHNTACWYPYI